MTKCKIFNNFYTTRNMETFCCSKLRVWNLWWTKKIYLHQSTPKAKLHTLQWLWPAQLQLCGVTVINAQQLQIAYDMHSPASTRWRHRVTTDTHTCVGLRLCTAYAPVVSRCTHSHTHARPVVGRLISQPTESPVRLRHGKRDGGESLGIFTCSLSSCQCLSGLSWFNESNKSHIQVGWWLWCHQSVSGALGQQPKWRRLHVTVQSDGWVRAVAVTDDVEGVTAAVRRRTNWPLFSTEWLHYIFASIATVQCFTQLRLR